MWVSPSKKTVYIMQALLISWAKGGLSVLKKLQECRKWLDEAKYIDEHSSITEANAMMVDAWFEYWIFIKEKTVRPNTVRNYRERYHRNISKVIGKMLLIDVKPIHCQKIFSDMADEGYKTTTIYQTRIALYNMLDFAKENDVIINNPCKKSAKSDMGQPSDKKEALTIDVQRKFLEAARDQSYENQYRFVLQTGIRTGELVGLKWDDIDFKNKTLTISRTMEYRYKVGIKRFSMHVLRHTFATRCIEAGMMPKTLQKILGHSNIGITMNLYVHITEDEKHKEIELVAGALKVI